MENESEERERISELIAENIYNAIICQDNFTAHFISTKHLHSYATLLTYSR
jgi:hypothetical protein